MISWFKRILGLGIQAGDIYFFHSKLLGRNASAHVRYVDEGYVYYDLIVEGIKYVKQRKMIYRDFEKLYKK